MKRRRYLTLIAAAGAAGCSTNSDATTTAAETTSEPTTEGSTTTTVTATPTASPTATPEPASFEIEWQTPQRVAVGEIYRISFIVTNTGEQTGTFRSNLQARVDGESQWTDGRQFDQTLEPGESWTYRSPTAQPDQGGEVELRLEDYGEPHSLEVYFESTAPEITDVNLVSSWESYGDALENAITSAPVGDLITIAFRHQAFIHEGTFHIFQEGEIYDLGTGDRIDIQNFEDEQVVDGNGYQTWEGSFEFDTTDWETGGYRAEVQLRDEVTSEVSNTESTTFELTR